MERRYRAAKGINGLVLCYSADWTRRTAFEVLFRDAHPDCEVLSTGSASDLLRLLSRLRPQCLILDVVARNHVGLLYNLRRCNRNAHFVIIQNSVRLSDKAVANYIGRTLFVESAGLLPDTLRQYLKKGIMQTHFFAAPHRHFLPESEGAVPAMETVLTDVEECLYRLLAKKVRSTRLCHEARQWFAGGEKVSVLAVKAQTDKRKMYQRRAALCQLLKTRTRELPLSLTVIWGQTFKEGGGFRKYPPE